MEKDKKADLVLSDGREINFDLRAVTVGEWRNVLDPRSTVEDEDEFAVKVSGLPLEDYLGLSMYDHKRFWVAFRQKRQEPIDPN